MTKQEAIALIEKYVPDGEEIAGFGWQSRSDLEQTVGQPVSDEQWDQFDRWYDKYQDAGADFDEALRYAQISFADEEDN